MSSLDCCYYILLSGILRQLIDKLEKVQNYSARLIFKTRKRTHVSSISAKVHWLWIAERIDSKTSCWCNDVVPETAPPYLSYLLRLYVPSRSLRSSADTRTFRIPTLSHLGPVTWNKLSYSVRHAQTQSQFKTQLKNTIPLIVRTRLLELLCVFNCSSYFSSCKTAYDLHLCVSE